MNKKLTGIIAVVLALAIVVSAGIYARDSRLKASDENVYEDASGAAQPATDIQEIIIETEPAVTPTVEQTQPEEPAEVPGQEPEELPGELPLEESVQQAEEEPATLNEELTAQEAAEEAETGTEEAGELPAEAPVEETVQETAQEAEQETAEEPAEEPEEVTEQETAEEPGEEQEEEPADEPEEEEEERVLRVWVTTSLDGVDTVAAGTKITLTAHLEGFEGLSYRLQWQRSLDGIEWKDEPGATEMIYSFILTDDNDDFIWRIMVYPA